MQVVLKGKTLEDFAGQEEELAKVNVMYACMHTLSLLIRGIHPYTHHTPRRISGLRTVDKPKTPIPPFSHQRYIDPKTNQNFQIDVLLLAPPAGKAMVSALWPKLTSLKWVRSAWNDGGRRRVYTYD